MTNGVTRAIVITGKYAVRTSPREKRNIDPDAKEQACTCQELSQFVELSAETHIQDESNVMKYY